IATRGRSRCAPLTSSERSGARPTSASPLAAGATGSSSTGSAVRSRASGSARRRLSAPTSGRAAEAPPGGAHFRTGGRGRACDAEPERDRSASVVANGPPDLDAVQLPVPERVRGERAHGFRHRAPPLPVLGEPVPDARGTVVPVDVVEADDADDLVALDNRG